MRQTSIHLRFSKLVRALSRAYTYSYHSPSAFPLFLFSLKRKGTNFIIILLLSIENIKGMEGIFERAKAINIRRVYIDSHGWNLKVISSNKKLLAKIKILNRTPILSTQCWHIRGISLEIDTQKYRIKLNRCKSRFRDYLVEESFYKSIIYYYFDNLMSEWLDLLSPRIY